MTMHSSRQRSEFPTSQMTILAICRICEPIAFMSIFPYVYYMVQDFGIAKNESEISIFTGMITSAFTIAEFSAGVAWGKVSDQIGRKPVLITGLAGTALSMLIFGLAPNFQVALFARALGGLLNGNMGVLQTTVAEMITNKEHQPRAYTIMPFVWCLGSILGPILGGALARPVINYPSIFENGSIWARYPYFLPNLICTIIVIFGVTIGVLFLEETHSLKKHRRDPGLLAGKWILARCSSWKSKFLRSATEKDENKSETLPLLHEEQLSVNTCTPTEPSMAPHFDSNSRLPISKIFTRNIIINIACFGILAYHTMTLDSMMPIFLSYPKPHNQSSWKLPFKFSMGYGLSTKEIGMILSVQGIYSMLVTLCIFPTLVRRFGAMRLFRTVAICYPILYLSIPYFSLLPPSLSIFGIYFIAIWKCTFATLAFPSNAMMLTNMAPSLLSMGTINGVAASIASLSRALGPTVSGALISVGQSSGYSGLSWWCSAVISIAGALLSLMMKVNYDLQNVDEKIDPESGLDSNDTDG
ncbi:putative membrane protein [Golovinomyces cichoracearum]|uniref:Putative membrane protein n=1 Tax=Golovinomyces cichoracearum TaxID=62708 RepID=A0A420IX93_9PEZI|nr:putative membrane protein [Golovinomyces cichoracearum]